MEIWKIYKKTRKATWEVSNYGNVKCNGENYECKKDNNDYLKFSKHFVHRAVAELFIPNPDNKPCIDHINTIRTDNNMENLRWCTQKENCNNLLTKKHNSEVRKGGRYPIHNSPHSEEARQKMSEALKGKNHPRARAVAKCSLDGEILEIRSYLRAFCKDGFNHGSISSCCSGKLEKYKGFKWQYIN